MLSLQGRPFMGPALIVGGLFLAVDDQPDAGPVDPPILSRTGWPAPPATRGEHAPAKRCCA